MSLGTKSLNKKKRRKGGAYKPGGREWAGGNGPLQVGLNDCVYNS